MNWQRRKDKGKVSRHVEIPSNIKPDTYMQVNYPRTQTNIAYISKTGLRAHIIGAVYYVQDLVESGYTFSPLIALTPEVVNALRVICNTATFGLGESWDEPGVKESVDIVRDLLAQVEGDNDATE